MEFPGFEREDFEVFAIPDFPGRMAAIREQIRPKLLALGEELAPRIEEAVGLPTFPHTAQHMRRRVNPPVETWAAFTRDKKGYKRWTHFRVAIREAGVRVTVFVEDDADDKAQFGANLQAASAEMLAALGPDAPIVWYTLGDGDGTPHAAVTAETLEGMGAALQRLKTAKFQAGIAMPRDEAASATPAELREWALRCVQRLRPLYLAGAQPDYRP